MVKKRTLKLLILITFLTFIFITKLIYISKSHFEFEKDNKKYLLNKKSKTEQNENVNIYELISMIKNQPYTTTKRKLEKKIFFLKTHKTGSSTIYNMLGIYSLKNNLTSLIFHINNKETYYWPSYFSEKLIIPNKHKNVKIYDLYMEHIRYNKSGCEIYFPRQETFYFTILREPISQWISAFYYFNFNSLFKQKNDENTIEIFLKRYNDVIYYSNVKKYTLLNMIWNSNLFDFGYDGRNINKENIDQIIKEIEKNFDLIILTEYFDYGLVILKNKLNLTFLDIAVLKVNESLNKKKPKLSQDTINKIDKFVYGDKIIYNYFKKKFQPFLQDVNIQKDVKKLKAYRYEIYKMCMSKRIPKVAYNHKFYLGFQMRYGLPNHLKTFCHYLTLSELEIKNLLFKQSINYLYNV